MPADTGDTHGVGVWGHSDGPLSLLITGYQDKDPGHSCNLSNSV